MPTNDAAPDPERVARAQQRLANLSDSINEEDLRARLNQLETQQGLVTQALVAALQGQWVSGPQTVEAYVYALDPSLQGTLVLDPPAVVA